MKKYTAESHLATVKDAEDFCFFLFISNFKIDPNADDWLHKNLRLKPNEREYLNRLCREAKDILAKNKETVEGTVRKIRLHKIRRLEMEHAAQRQRTRNILRMNGML